MAAEVCRGRGGGVSHRPVLPDEISAVAQQVLLGGPTEFQGPEVVQTHFGRARLAWIAAEQVMHLKTRANQTIIKFFLHINGCVSA